SCPGSEALAALLDRRLAGAEADAVSRHVATCPDCGAAFADAATFLYGENPAGDVRPGPVPGRRWVMRGLAATLVAGLAGWWALQGPRPAAKPSAQQEDSGNFSLLKHATPAQLVAGIGTPEDVNPLGYQDRSKAARGVRRGQLEVDRDVAQAA